MTDTVRLTNLKYILTVLEGLDLTGLNDRDSIEQGVAAKFDPLMLGPIGDKENRRRYSAGVVTGDEIVHVLFPWSECTLPVTVEFRMTWNTGDQLPAEEAERLLGLMQGGLSQDPTLGGNAIDFKEVGNAVVADLYTDKMIVGAIHFTLQYRRATLDPTQIV